MISVCIATYNGENYLSDQLNSIINQLSEDDEIILSDDQSTDKTIIIATSFAKKFYKNKIKIIVNKKRLGYVKNFEQALSKASGSIIFLADQDDVWQPDKVKITLNYLEKYDFVVSDNIVVDKNLTPTHLSHFDLCSTKSGFIYNLLFPRYVGACMAFKRNVLEKSLPFPKNAQLIAHDYWICLVAEMYFETTLIRDPLILYRRHDNNASNGGQISVNSLKYKLSVRIYALIHVLKIFFR